MQVKKLNARQLRDQPKDENPSSAPAPAPKNTPKGRGGDTPGVRPGGYSKGRPKPSSAQLAPPSDKTAPQAPITKTDLKKGSKTNRKTLIQNGLSDSSLSKVQKVVAIQSHLNKLDVNSSKESEVDLNSEIANTLRPCGDTLSDEKSDIVNVDSESNCKILMPTQNFSDQEETLNNQKNLSQVKSGTCKQTAPDKSFKETLVENSVKEKINNKANKNVEVLNPKEKSEVVVLNSVILKHQNEGLSEASEIEPPRDTSTGQSPNKNRPKVNKTDKQIAQGKNKKVTNWKENEKEKVTPKVVHHQSPKISKSLMNYKIPLKNSAHKPFVNHKLENKASPTESPYPSSNRIPTPLFSIPPKTPLLPTPPIKPLLPTPQFKPSLSTPPVKPLLQPSIPKPPLSTLKTKPLLATHTNKPSLSTPLQNKHSFSSKRPTASNTSSSNPISPADKNNAQVNALVKKMAGHNPKGDLSTHPISSQSQSSPLQSNSPFNPQRNNNNTDSHLIKAKTLTENSFKTRDKETLLNPFRNKTQLLSKEKKKIKMSFGAAQIRRSGRPVKKKSFGDDILFLDEKTPIVSDEDKDQSSDSDEVGCCGCFSIMVTHRPRTKLVLWVIKI